MASRNFHGYGNSPPTVVWPNNSRIAISVVVNYEEGSEYSILDGDEAHESNNEVPHCRYGLSWGDSAMQTCESGHKLDVAPAGLLEDGDPQTGL